MEHTANDAEIWQVFEIIFLSRMFQGFLGYYRFSVKFTKFYFYLFKILSLRKKKYI